MKTGKVLDFVVANVENQQQAKEESSDYADKIAKPSASLFYLSLNYLPLRPVDLLSYEYSL